MNLQPRARFRLLRRRVRARFQTALGLAIIIGAFVTVCRWGGYKGLFRWENPIPLTDALPEFPMVAGFIFIGYLLWPFRHRDEDTFPS